MLRFDAVEARGSRSFSGMNLNIFMPLVVGHRICDAIWARTEDLDMSNVPIDDLVQDQHATTSGYCYPSGS